MNTLIEASDIDIAKSSAEEIPELKLDLFK